MDKNQDYRRYGIETKLTPHLIPHPHRFKVKVKRHKLAMLLLKEIFHYRGKLAVITSRPCVYGVFSGPIGGFAPRESLCVGCLRCTTQYPEMVTILKNPARLQQGDSYFIPDYVDTVANEAETGLVPIKGAGYRGKFGGTGWDGLWTDMSEIVRPTRDGIHGREFISTELDIGGKPAYLQFNAEKKSIGSLPHTVSAAIPLLFDLLPSQLASRDDLCSILSEAARSLQTFAVMPVEIIQHLALENRQLIPLATPTNLHLVNELRFTPHFIEMSEWHEPFYQKILTLFPDSYPILRTSFDNDQLIHCYQAGLRIFHLTANYHGRGKDNQFILNLIREAHQKFVQAGIRDQVTLIGSGGIIAAEHLPKAILCGLDAVALDTPLLVALQAKFQGECLNNSTSHFDLQQKLPVAWGIQRVKNLAGAWISQLLEVMGAMGLREVRRMRGEMGRAMFQKDLENEAFTGIAGYEIQ